MSACFLSPLLYLVIVAEWKIYCGQLLTFETIWQTLGIPILGLLSRLQTFMVLGRTTQISNAGVINYNCSEYFSNQAP